MARTLNTPHVQLWVQTLRSGEIEQAEGWLRDAEGDMCCLGVACELLRRERPTEFRWILAGDHYDFCDADGNPLATQELPYVAQLWLGVDETNPYVTVPGHDTRDLASLNDDGSPFRVIADLIEHDPELGDGANQPGVGAESNEADEDTYENDGGI